MQVQIRNPVAVEVDAADDKGSVSFRFFTAAEHQAVVTIGRDLLPDLIEQLEEIVAAEAKQSAPQPAARDFTLIERDISRDTPLAKPSVKPKESAREHQPAHQPVLRALLQA